MAGRPAAVFQLLKHRLLLTAPRHGMAAAGVEAAARRRVHGAGDISFQNDLASLAPGIQRGHGRQQRLGVGMGRFEKQGVFFGQLDDFSEIQESKRDAPVFMCCIRKDQAL